MGINDSDFPDSFAFIPIPLLPDPEGSCHKPVKDVPDNQCPNPLNDIQLKLSSDETANKDKSEFLSSNSFVISRHVFFGFVVAPP